MCSIPPGAGVGGLFPQATVSHSTAPPHCCPYPRPAPELRLFPCMGQPVPSSVRLEQEQLSSALSFQTQLQEKPLVSGFPRPINHSYQERFPSLGLGLWIFNSKSFSPTSALAI